MKKQQNQSAAYQTRTIRFRALMTIEEWSIKVYTISITQDFNNSGFYNAVNKKLPEWLNMTNSFNAENDKIGFLILHEGTEGLFSIINWWVGKNMLNTHIFFSDHEQPGDFKKISGDGLAPCIWELEIINHERLSWMNNILKKSLNPDFEAYLSETISCEL